ncbi:MarR family transcriptional regulator [Chitinophaga sp. 212800010-3]|uniref:MarR family winged helix-turn-helix transcriptional regulator n=1 Tax=unclassified Chitinophaga TaxID=2619133 RepID=UPI002DE5E6CE|nr:HTH marR-type domain-containing protein [Chitinophaga sp. 212800010-3]
MSQSDAVVIGQALRDLVTKMSKRLRRQVGNLGAISHSEGHVMSLLMSQQEAYPSELGTALRISSQFMSQILNRLEGLGYISRRAAPDDGRKTLVSLTKKGRGMVEESRREREEWLAAVIAEKYTAKEMKVIREALALLATLPDA